MNLSKPMRATSRFVHKVFHQCRRYMPRQRCDTFVSPSEAPHSGISSIYVINLDRQADRWNAMQRELGCVLDADGIPLTKRAIRFSACDAQADASKLLGDDEVSPSYTLGDQLFVEPQPSALPEAFDLVSPITMSDAEVAVARSHIGVWRKIAQSTGAYALVLEDDVWIKRRFARIIDEAWTENKGVGDAAPIFDLLYVSYKEVRHGAPKELVSKNVFRPERGLWFLSGYVMSRKGAQALLRLLPSRGPIDLWINHKFHQLVVRALRCSVINQRLDIPSTNSYSILPALTRIGVLSGSDTALFHQRPAHSPVFAFGAPGSGQSSLAMALMMLGYRCCSDLDEIPISEFERLVSGHPDRVFNAYVNIGALRSHGRLLKLRYPRAKFIVIVVEAGITDHTIEEVLDALKGADLLRLRADDANTWPAICEHLRLPPPAASYPIVQDIGELTYRPHATPTTRRAKRLRHDRSPWVVEARPGWAGIEVSIPDPSIASASRLRFEDDLGGVQSARWLLRHDTFPGNLALFRPANVTAHSGGGLELTVAQEPLGVRDLSAAAMSSRRTFLYGRFEVTLQPTSVPGLVTGFFLHRDSPRQEIDIEITGNHPSRLLMTVFYNPGAEGAKFDYGYRGAPAVAQLGFDASKAQHRFAIEWGPCEIRWLVDGELIHRRAAWNPTPIPHLPMMLHVNTWPARSRELAGRLAFRELPASAIVRSIAVDALSLGEPPPYR